MKSRYLKWYAEQPMARAAYWVTREPCAAIRVDGMCPANLIYTPMPPVDHPLYTLDECIERRAKSLLAKHRKICVLWSAGLDSTAAAAALLAYKDDHHTIFISKDVLAQDESYTAMADRLAEMGGNFISVSRDNSQQLIAEGVYFVSGSHGDLIHLQDEWIGCRGLDYDATRKLNARDTLMTRCQMTPAEADICLYHLKPLIDAMPEHIPRTGVNINWWIGFTTLWDYDVYHMPFIFGFHPNDGCPFFNTDDFQRWAMQDSSSKLVPGDPCTKSQLKKITNTLMQSDFPLNKNYTNEDTSGPTQPGFVELFSNEFKVIWEDLTYIVD